MLSIPSYSQITGGGTGNKEINTNKPSVITDEKNAFAIQAFKFGLGIDYERLVGKNNGIAISVGILGMEVESKFHFKPQINSSSIGIGTGVYFLTGAWVTQLFFEYRANKYFTGTVGGGFSMYDEEIFPAFRLCAGVYFPW